MPMHSPSKKASKRSLNGSCHPLDSSAQAISKPKPAPKSKPKSKLSAGAAQSTTRRCAIYTRKSSEEGLEQAFNSLDAQREACEAFIRSQRHEGWVLLPTAYDDGGISGGTLERPALRQLLADISIGKVDLVISIRSTASPGRWLTSPRSSRCSMPRVRASSRSPSSLTPQPRWAG